MFKLTVVNDLECDIFDRGGGRGGGVINDVGERFRLGNGSVFPIKLISPATLFVRRFPVDIDCTDELPLNFVNNTRVFSFRFIIDFFGKTGN